jgi:hypothetical protein
MQHGFVPTSKRRPTGIQRRSGEQPRDHTASGPEGVPIAEYSVSRTTFATAETWRATNISPFGTLTTTSGSGPVPPWRFAGQIELPFSDARAWVSA